MKRRKNGKDGSLADGVAQSIAHAIIRVQLALSGLLAKWERKRTRTQKKALFLLFVALFGGYCTYVLAEALFRQGKGAAPHRATGVELHQPLVLPEYQTGKSDTAEKPIYKTKKQQ